jgi:hypothetical protein|tara:strand:+ start:634 stop:1479 length:846 start_codon:yes stop_codon:yes gene_type:complete
MTDYINSFFSKKSYVLIFMIFPLFFWIFGLYFGFKIWEKNPDSDLGVYLINVSNVIYLACVFVQTHLDWNKYCASCGSRNLECLETRINSFYEKTNKDGSADKRYKDNRIIGYLSSDYSCIDCNAETHFSSKSARKPSKKTKVRTGTLTKDGSERKTKDVDIPLEIERAVVSEPRNESKTVLVKRKTGSFAAFRKLQILVNENVLLKEISQGESIELEINEDHEFIFGKMDWAYTNKINIKDISKIDYLEISNIFTLNPLRHLGIGNLPIIFSIKKKNKNS